METWEKELRIHNLQKSIDVDLNFDTPVEIVKARSGVYANNDENRKHGRAGERYGKMIDGGQTQSIEDEKLITNHRDKNNTHIKIGDTIVWEHKHVNGRVSYKKGTVLKDTDQFGAHKVQFEGEKIPASGVPFSNTTVIDEIKEISDSYNREEEKHQKKLKDFYGDSDGTKKAIENILKAFDNGLLSKDVFEKGKLGQIGETRTWNGVQMKKVSNTGNSAKDWQPVKQGENKPGEKPAGKEEPKLTEDDLKEHAKNASEQALAAAIKTSPDPTVRQVAHAEMKRRQEEEKTGAEDSFPGKEPEKVKFAEKPATNLKNPEKKESEKKPEVKKPEANLGEKHKKELDDHQNKTLSAMQDRMNANKDILSRHEKERKTALDAAQGSEEGVKKLKEVNDRHSKEWKEHNDKHQVIEDKLKGEHKQLTEKHKTEKDALNTKPEAGKQDTAKLKKIVDEIGHDMDGAAKKYFKDSKAYGGCVYIMYKTLKDISSGTDPNEAFAEACDDENFHGDRSDIKADRDLVQKVLKEVAGVNVSYRDDNKSKPVEKSIQGIRYF